VDKTSDEVRKEFERRVHILERDMTNRIDGNSAFQEAINKKVAAVTDVHTVLNNSVQNCSKNLSTFKKEREDKDATVKKKLDDLSQGLQQANAKVRDVQQQKKVTEEVLKRDTHTDDIVDAQGAKFQELEDQLAGQKSLLYELQVATTTRDDEFREWQTATAVLQSWRQATDTTLEQLLRTEASGSLETTVIKDQNRSKKGQQSNTAKQRSNAATLLLSNETNRRQDGKEDSMANTVEVQETSRTGPAESDMAIAAKATRAGPAQSGTTTTGKGANRTGPEQSAMTSAEKGNDNNVSETVSEVFQKIQNDIIHLNMPLVPTKTSLEEGCWSEAQECMRAMEQRFSECVRSVEIQLSIETQERCLQLLDLQSRVCERWEADRFERDINILDKVFNAKKLLQRQAKQGETIQSNLQQPLTTQQVKL
jgi:hypothetical protein